MRPYAENAIRESQPATTRAIGFYLAALTGLTSAQPQNLAFAKSYAGDMAAYAYMGLAETFEAQTLNSALQTTADKMALSTALSYAKFVQLSDAEKKAQGGGWIKSGDAELQSLVMRKALTMNRTDWLERWGVAHIEKSEAAGERVAIAEPWQAALITTLGYALLLNNGQLAIERLPR